MQSPRIEFARRSDCDVMVLSPPYKTVRPREYGSSQANPPLGTVVLGHGSDTLATLAEVTAAVHRWRWVIPCIVSGMDRVSLEPLLMLVSELRGRLAVVKPAREGPVYNGSAILTAVRSRGIPSADLLGEYLRGRLDNTRLWEGIVDQFHCELNGQRTPTMASASTYCRLFAPFGCYTARDWRAIARLCVHCVATGSWQSSGTLPIRTARHYLRKYLQLPYHALAERVGWEWILEGALRTGYYLKDDP